MDRSNHAIIPGQRPGSEGDRDPAATMNDTPEMGQEPVERLHHAGSQADVGCSDHPRDRERRKDEDLRARARCDEHRPRVLAPRLRSSSTCTALTSMPA